jgi:hypothetical protein
MVGHPVTDDPPKEAASKGPLDRRLCQVVGLNQNYASPSGALYHVQIEDRGPVLDPLTEREVRRVNVIVYANYGETNARIIHGRDHDLEDVRTAEYNKIVEQRIKELAAASRTLVAEWEERQVERIKRLLRQYYVTKDETAKKDFEAANALYPFLFSRAWRELKSERSRAEATPQPRPAPPADLMYPLDPEQLGVVLEIERLIGEIAHDLGVLRERGIADDILVQTCRKMVGRARDSLSEGGHSEFGLKRLEMTRGSLVTTWRQVKSRLRQG